MKIFKLNRVLIASTGAAFFVLSLSVQAATIGPITPANTTVVFAASTELTHTLTALPTLSAGTINDKTVIANGHISKVGVPALISLRWDPSHGEPGSAFSQHIVHSEEDANAILTVSLDMSPTDSDRGDDLWKVPKVPVSEITYEVHLDGQQVVAPGSYKLYTQAAVYEQ